jgi:hypothetical protein
MARRISVAFLSLGFGLNFFLPVVGVLVMLTGAVWLAIMLEDDLRLAEPEKRWNQVGQPVAWSTSSTTVQPLAQRRALREMR